MAALAAIFVNIMKMTIISESSTAARIPTITFAVYRDIIYSQVENNPSPLQRLNFADAFDSNMITVA